MREVLPLAVAIAASPFPVIPAILLLFTARPRATSLAFLGGWLLGILGGCAAFVLLSEVVESFGESPTWVSWVRLALGVALLAYGIRQWLTRASKAEQPAWMRSLAVATPASAVRLALLLSAANPKVLLMSAAAGLAIGTGDVHGWAEARVVLGFTVVAALSVAVPVLGYVVLGDRVLRPLGAAKDWLTAHNAAVMAVVLVAIGLALTVKGIQGL